MLDRYRFRVLRVIAYQKRNITSGRSGSAIWVTMCLTILKNPLPMKEITAEAVVVMSTEMGTLIFGTALLDPLGVVEVKGRVNRQWRLIFHPNTTP